MQATKKPLPENEMGTGLKRSLFVHFAIFIAIFIKCMIFPDKPLIYIPTLRVDLVGLPDILKKDLSKYSKLPANSQLDQALKNAETDAKNIKAVPPATPDEMIFKPQSPVERLAREKKLKNALARIKALNKIDAESTTKSAPLIKGNAISKGTSLSADARESAQTSYFDMLRERLREYWSLPVWIARQNYSAQVQIFIDARGKLYSYRFIKLSGNAQFDDAVKRTITESQPYPQPPESMITSLLSNGILVGFPL